MEFLFLCVGSRKPQKGKQRRLECPTKRTRNHILNDAGKEINMKRLWVAIALALSTGLLQLESIRAVFSGVFSAETSGLLFDVATVVVFALFLLSAQRFASKHAKGWRQTANGVH